MKQPLCLVTMPAGPEKDAEGKAVNFDTVYRELIQPAIEAAGLRAIRTDSRRLRNDHSQAGYEQLILSDYAVVDISTATPEVMYALGLRLAAKPYTTLALHTTETPALPPLPFLRSLSYNAESNSAQWEEDQKKLTALLLKAQEEPTPDNPLFQLLDGAPLPHTVAHEKADIFRDVVQYNETLKQQLARARRQGTREDKLNAMNAMVDKLALATEEAAVLVDIMLSYRSIGSAEAYERMVDFIRSLPAPVQQTVIMQEQLGFALNRLKRHDEALEVLNAVLAEHGPSSETYSLIGRVHKDLFDQARQDNHTSRAETQLKLAAETYRRGFEADWRDALPGINALTLLELQGKREEHPALGPAVAYAVTRKIAARQPDYWDYAALVEIAVIENNQPEAQKQLEQALNCPIEGDWMLDTTLKNMELLRFYRTKRKEDTRVPEHIIQLLQEAKKRI